MSSLTIRISRSTHDKLIALSEETGLTMSTIVDRAVQEFRRTKFWEDYHAAYAALRDDPAAWAEYMREREEWEAGTEG